MAQWKETLEPYVKVQERVKTATLNPTAGEDLIIGVAFISDAGPSTPTLITSQSEFLSTYASKDLDQEYIESLNNLYNGEGGNDLASTMWSNAYRLAGSNSLLCVRASKGDNLYFSKPLTTDNTSNDTYILRDGELLKKVNSFCFSLDDIGDESETGLWDLDGWIINISGIGIFGNRVTDDGAQYDYYCQNLADLVKQLNDTSVFFSPEYTFYDSDIHEMTVDMDDVSSYGSYDIRKVKLTEVYLGQKIIDKSDPRTKKDKLVEVSEWSNVETYSIDDVVKVTTTSTIKQWEQYGEPVTEEPQSPIQPAPTSFDPTQTPADTYSTDDKVYVANFPEEGQYTIYVVTETETETYTIYKSRVDNNEDKSTTDTNYWKDVTSSVKTKSSYSDIISDTDKKVGNIYSCTEDEQVKYYTICEDDTNAGMLFIYTINSEGTGTVDLDEDIDYSNFTAASNYAINVYNSTSELGVRIRKFNHNAVISKNLSNSELDNLYKDGPSPYTVLPTTVANLDLNSKSTLENDFYEIAVYDPSVNEVVSFFNVGKKISRGDMEVSEVNNLLSMIQLSLPDNMNDLGLDYYGIENVTGETFSYDEYTTYSKNQVVYVESGASKTVYRSNIDGNVGNDPATSNNWKKIDTPSQIYANLSIGLDDMSVITISDSDLKRALDLIVLDEVYTTEGLCDLGNTDTSFQNYMANIAINDNYFYPISTVNSTNYMVIGNSATKIAADSYKLYMSSPWDIDTGTLGWKFYASPSVLYWETVAKNRRNNREFAPMFGQDNGTMQYQRPFTEFNKKTRQLLLSRKINTVMWDVALQAWVMNDNYTKQTENTIMNDEGNSRLMIRISKAMPIILKQFLGKRISEKLCESVESTIDYFFKTNILKMDYSIDSYLITCKYDEALARQNKIRVKVEVKYQRALKYIEVFNEAIEVGMDFEG